MCLFPVRAQKQDIGKPKLDPEGDIFLPCGKCSECKSKRASEWAIRCKHEIACHDENCFITLTYDEEHLPSHLIVKDEFQKFMKKVRKKAKSKLKYIVSHEYGGKSGRPHHHVIIFGWSPNHQKFLMAAPQSGEPLFTSTEISDLWKNGFHSIGEANEKTAYYIAAYSLKSSTHHVTDPDTGEYFKVSDSMNVSTRPAIGKEYFLNNIEQVLNTSTVLPRYYKKLLERDYPDLLEEYENTQLKINERGSHEKLAKHVITEQKKYLESPGLRSAPEDRRESNFYTTHLKRNRDDYKQFIDKKEIT
jgi:hypothetical protein